jgi:ArsR family transcriptional regulator
MNETDVIKALSALAHSNRLVTFRSLVVAGPAGLSAGELAERLEIPAATLSFHLKELLHAGLVSQERSGRNLIYRADYDCMNGLIGYLTENCCEGQPCITSDAVACPCEPDPAENG